MAIECKTLFKDRLLLEEWGSDKDCAVCHNSFNVSDRIPVVHERMSSIGRHAFSCAECLPCFPSIDLERLTCPMCRVPCHNAAPLENPPEPGACELIVSLPGELRACRFSIQTTSHSNKVGLVIAMLTGAFMLIGGHLRRDPNGPMQGALYLAIGFTSAALYYNNKAHRENIRREALDFGSLDYRNSVTHLNYVVASSQKCMEIGILIAFSTGFTLIPYKIATVAGLVMLARLISKTEAFYNHYHFNGVFSP